MKWPMRLVFVAHILCLQDSVGLEYQCRKGPQRLMSLMAAFPRGKADSERDRALPEVTQL